jgi:hypothetical protein
MERVNLDMTVSTHILIADRTKQRNLANPIEYICGV